MSKGQNGGEQSGGQRKPPAHVITLGRIRATIWSNESAEGTYYSVTLTRLYRDGGGKTKSASSLGRDDILPAAEALRLAYQWVAAKSPEAALALDSTGGQ
jgi:hypothetical protein